MAQQFGLGNFVYEVEVKDGAANFTFRDPEDAANTAEVTISKDDFNGFAADSRQVADLAYDQCQRVLNDKRDARIKKEAADQLAKKVAEDKRVRQEAEDFLATSEDVAVKPAHVDKDGTTVYNTAPIDEADDKKKK